MFSRYTSANTQRAEVQLDSHDDALGEGGEEDQL